jgi:hypothetical protein
MQCDGSLQKTDVRPFAKESLIKGKPAQIPCVEIDGQTYSIANGAARLISLEDEWFDDVRDPDLVVRVLRNNPKVKADLFTFLQRLPDIEPKYNYPFEWESVAAVQVRSYEHWWNKQVKGTTRNMVRKSQKAGVEVRGSAYDDSFVGGMVEIFNEVPVRQGRRFWHYGKDFDTVKRQFSRFIFREQMIGAYYGGELIGFVMLADAGRYAVLGQIVSMIRHRDKAVNNALMAKVVEVCAMRQLPYLLYGYWDDSTLVDFKRHCGFEEVKLPRYYVPLRGKGQVALNLGLHHGWKECLPACIKTRLKRIRTFCQIRAGV